MNYQFLGTAGVVSCILIVITSIIALLYEFTDLHINDIFMRIVGICILSIVVFWFVIGSICWLDAIWGWGLVR